jgi:hypothetical protein
MVIRLAESNMGKKHKDKQRDEERDEEHEDEESEDEECLELELTMVDDAVIDVSFGDPEDDELDSERVIDWVSSFRPGQFQKQVADLFLADGEIYVVLDKMSVTIPLMEVFRLLEKGGFFKAPE